MEISKKIQVISYTLKDQIPGFEGFEVPVDSGVKTKFEELVNTYKDEIKLKEEIQNTKKSIKSAEGNEFDKLIENYQSLTGLNKMIEMVKDRALNMEGFPFSKEHGYGIYKIKIEKNAKQPIYFEDIFDKNLGAHIEHIKQTIEAGQGMGMKADFDEYEIKIENKQKNISCNIEWSH